MFYRNILDLLETQYTASLHFGENENDAGAINMKNRGRFF